MPKVRWDYADPEDYDDESDYVKFEKIKHDSRPDFEDDRPAKKKKTNPKHQQRPDKR